MKFFGNDSIYKQGEKAGARKMIEEAQKMVKKNKMMYGYLAIIDLQEIYKGMFNEEYK